MFIPFNDLLLSPGLSPNRPTNSEFVENIVQAFNRNPNPVLLSKTDILTVDEFGHYIRVVRGRRK